MMTQRSQTLHIVGLMAFGQSLLFLLLWLFICMSAGAAATPQKPKPELEQSVYEPSSARNPFVKPGTPTAGAQTIGSVPLVFRLQGILYSSKRPAAMINNVLVELDKPVTITSGNVEVEVKAVAITRDTVVLEAGGQRAELRMSVPDSPANPGKTEPKAP